MTKLFHRGAPCEPPVVNGITFAQDKKHEHLYSAEVDEAQLAMFEGVDTFSVEPQPVEEPKAEPVAAPVAPATSAEVENLKAQVLTLSEENTQLAAENRALREENAELLRIDEEVATEPMDQVKAEVEALEAKKAAGQTTAAENMKLGKLKKRLQA